MRKVRKRACSHSLYLDKWVAPGEQAAAHVPLCWSLNSPTSLPGPGDQARSGSVLSPSRSLRCHLLPAQEERLPPTPAAHGLRCETSSLLSTAGRGMEGCRRRKHIGITMLLPTDRVLSPCQVLQFNTRSPRGYHHLLRCGLSKGTVPSCLRLWRGKCLAIYLRCRETGHATNRRAVELKLSEPSLHEEQP